MRIDNPILGSPVSGDFSVGTFTWPTFNQSTTGSAGSVANALTIGTGLSGTSYNGSSAVTIAINSTVALRTDTHYIGTTAVALNRVSANLALTGISSITLPGVTSGTVQLLPTAISGTTTLTLPATSGTVALVSQIPTVTNTTVTATIYNAVATFGTVIVLCNTTSNSVTVNLPTAVNNTAVYIIKKTSAANSMIIDGFNAETIDGDTTITVVVENESLTLVSDNTNWKVI